MKKFRMLLLLLLSFSFATVIKAETVLPEPDIHIDGEYTIEQNGNIRATSAITISLTVDKSEYPNLYIQYKFGEGELSRDFSVYNKPIIVQRKGLYRIGYRSALASGDYGETIFKNIIVDMPYNESYENVIRNNQIINHKNTGTPIILPEYVEKDKDIRGVWVSTVSNIDIGKHYGDLEYKNEIISILNTIQKNNMNTVFFQVRPMNDAFYPSELAPYSAYIKGQQGLGLDWDILEFVIEESHKRGLELHAWLNPYRVANNPTQSPMTRQELIDTLHEDNFAKKHPEYTLFQTTGATLILDPGQPVVRQYLLDVIDELITNYDVDGIHFDDYFYVPNNEDMQTFLDHNPTGIGSIADWRRENVNIMVESVNNLVKSHNQATGRHIKFGISPVAIWRNGTVNGGSNTTGYSAWDGLYADTRKWVMEEWLDYICPQVYFDFSLTAAPFAVIVDWWANLIESNNLDVDLIIGLGFYRYTDKTPWVDENIIVEQIRYMSQYESVKGSVTFTYNTFVRSLAPINKTIERLNEYYWTKPVDFAWASDVEFVPEDDEETIGLKTDLQDLIDQIDTYMENNEVLIDTNIPVEERYLGTLYISKENNNLFLQAFHNGMYVVDSRIPKENLTLVTNELIAAFAAYKDDIYQGSVDLDRPDAVNNLEGELTKIYAFRAALNKSNGKSPEDLSKDKYYVANEILDALDLAISEAEAIIADESSFATEINARFHILKDKEADARANLFKGTADEETNGNGNGDDNDKDVDEVLTELEAVLTSLKAKLETIKTQDGKNKEDLPYGHKYVEEEYIAALTSLIVQAEEMIDEEEFTIEMLNDLIEDLEAAEQALDENVVVGEKEESYRKLLIIIGSVLGGLAIVGGATILILVKRKR